MDRVTICNCALTMLGMPCIVSLDEDGSTNARMCRQFYPVVLDRVLRDHTWSFAMRRAKLTPLADASDDPEYPYTCPLPDDCVRVVRLADGRPFSRRGKMLLCQTSVPIIEYVSRVDDPNEFDAGFTEALQYALAAELGMANTRDYNLINMYRAEYARRLAVARSIDSQENHFAQQNRRRMHSSWLEARRKGV